MNRAEHNRLLTRGVVLALVGIAAVFALYQIRAVAPHPRGHGNPAEGKDGNNSRRVER